MSYEKQSTKKAGSDIEERQRGRQMKEGHVSEGSVRSTHAHIHARAHTHGQLLESRGHPYFPQSFSRCAVVVVVVVFCDPSR